MSVPVAKDNPDTSTPIQVECQRHKVANLELTAKDKFMLAGSLVARQVSQTAALEEERSKMASLRFKSYRFGASPGPATARGACGVREVATQTEDADDLLRQEVSRLRRKRDQLVASTRTTTNSTVSMVELLKKRNAVLLAREERALERARAEHVSLQRRASQLEERLRLCTQRDK